MKVKAKSHVFVGIDPGITGAVAAIDNNGNFLNVWDTPSTVVKRGKKYRNVHLPCLMVEILRRITEDYRGVPITVALELVNAMPDQGVVSMFSMGYGLGLWEGIVTALMLPLERVTPVKWKHQMMGGGKGDGKQASIVRALELFPHAADHLMRKKDHGRAEALLIAEYFRRNRKAP